MNPQELLEHKRNNTFYKVQDGGHVKDVDFNKRTVTGFFNTYLYFDSDYDVMMPGSLKKSIDEHGPTSKSKYKIKHLKNHAFDKAPGVIEKLEEKTVTLDGKEVSGEYFESKMIGTTVGTDTLIEYQEGQIDQHSIGFRYIWDKIQLIEKDSPNEAVQEEWKRIVGMLINPEEAEEKGYLYAVYEVKQWEGSSLNLKGANILTPYLGSKALNKDHLKLKIFDRINFLQAQITKGQSSEERIFEYGIEFEQLKQIINDLFEPIKESTPQKEEPQKLNTQRNLDIQFIINNFKL